MRSLFLFLAISFFACDPECDIEKDTEMDPVVAAIVSAAEDGDIISIDDSVGDVEFDGITGVIPVRAHVTQTHTVPVMTQSMMLATCPALGLPAPEFNWFCEENHPEGRVIAKDDAEPDMDSFQVLDEYPSVRYPAPITGRLFFSQTIYPNHWGGPVAAMRGIITSWGSGPEWNDAREARCNSPVFEDHCSTEEKKMVPFSLSSGELQELLNAVEGGEVVFSEDTEETNSVVCPPFGLDPVEYWWFCLMTGTDGRAIAVDSVNPSSIDFAVYNESPSENYPGDMTGGVYFSRDIYELYAYSDLAFGELRGEVAVWGALWNLARVARCSEQEHEGDCNQDEPDGGV